MNRFRNSFPMFHQGLFQREIKGGRFSHNSLFVACVLPLKGLKFTMSPREVFSLVGIFPREFVGLSLIDTTCSSEDICGHVVRSFRDVCGNIWVICCVLPQYHPIIQQRFCSLMCDLVGDRYKVPAVGVAKRIIFPLEIAELCQFRPLSQFSNPENLQVVDNFSFKGGK